MNDKLCRQRPTRERHVQAHARTVGLWGGGHILPYVSPLNSPGYATEQSHAYNNCRFNFHGSRVTINFFPISHVQPVELALVYIAFTVTYVCLLPIFNGGNRSHYLYCVSPLF